MYRVKEGILGCAIGDALGISTRNLDRNYLLENPVLKMNSNIKEGIPAGAWSYNTSVIVSTIDSIKENNLDYTKIIGNIVKWFTINKYSSVNSSFGIDNESMKILASISNNEKIETNENYNNSSLTILFPIILYCMSNKKEDLYKNIKCITKLFNDNELSICGAYILTNFIVNLYNTNDKNKALKMLKNLDYSMFSNDVLNKYFRILIGDINDLLIEEINSTNYIVDTIESSIWCFMKSNNFKDSLIATTNLGGDTSTIGSITGLLSGIYYGINNIPKDWLNTLRKTDYLIKISDEYEKYLRILSYDN